MKCIIHTLGLLLVLMLLIFVVLLVFIPWVWQVVFGDFYRPLFSNSRLSLYYSHNELVSFPGAFGSSLQNIRWPCSNNGRPRVLWCGISSLPSHFRTQVPVVCSGRYSPWWRPWQRCTIADSFVPDTGGVFWWTWGIFLFAVGRPGSAHGSRALPAVSGQPRWEPAWIESKIARRVASLLLTYKSRWRRSLS